jgi:pilus assembly protein TadC
MDLIKSVTGRAASDPRVRQALELLKKAQSFISPKDYEQLRLTLDRLDKQEVWNDVFSTKLIEVLDKIDGIRENVRASLGNAAAMQNEAAERLRRVETSLFLFRMVIATLIGTLGCTLVLLAWMLAHDSVITMEVAVLLGVALAIGVTVACVGLFRAT